VLARFGKPDYRGTGTSETPGIKRSGDPMIGVIG